MTRANIIAIGSRNLKNLCRQGRGAGGGRNNEQEGPVGSRSPLRGCGSQTKPPGLTGKRRFVSEAPNVPARLKMLAKRNAGHSGSYDAIIRDISIGPTSVLGASKVFGIRSDESAPRCLHCDTGHSELSSMAPRRN